MHLGVADRTGAEIEEEDISAARNSTRLECVSAADLAPRQTHDCQSVGYFWQGLGSRQGRAH